MFRQERPQAGRLRQFHQYGAEVIGSQEPLLDAEIIALALQVCRSLGLSESTLKVNSVGCEKCRPGYHSTLTKFLTARAPQLSDESKARLAQNPLRVLDSKDERDQAMTFEAPLMKDHLCTECGEHFDRLLNLLREVNIPFVLDGRLVRGLDYYTKTAFEITSGSLGAQDALAGGGRYDLLIDQLGGKPTPAVGFAAGIERLMIVLSKEGLLPDAPPGPRLFLVALGDAARRWAFRKTLDLRQKGFSVEMDYLDRSVKAQMREANRSRAQYVLVVGDQELATGKFQLKEMAGGNETLTVESEIESSLQG
jgi:histidyl-tRNA synthetase